MPTIIVGQDIGSRKRFGTEPLSLYHLSPSAGPTGKAYDDAARDAHSQWKSYVERGFVPPRRVTPILLNTLSPNQAIRHILEAVDQSKSILTLEDDWDGEGSSAYKAGTWRKAIDFLKRNALDLWQSEHVSLDAPRISPGPDGSIDLHWKTSRRELLINIPEEDDGTINFYGDNKAGQVIKGPLDLSKNNQWLLMWLMQ